MERIIVGSKNPGKVSAVINALKFYTNFRDTKVISLRVDSGISDQPKSLEETTKGARNRSKNAFDIYKGSEGIYCIGLESGLISFPDEKTKYMDVCVCSIYDGTNYSFGLSCGFPFPTKIEEMIFNEKINAEKAAYKTGITENKKLGSNEGLIGLLTKNNVQIDRKDQMRLAVHMALIKIENKELYQQ